MRRGLVWRHARWVVNENAEKWTECVCVKMETWWDGKEVTNELHLQLHCIYTNDNVKPATPSTPASLYRIQADPGLPGGNVCTFNARDVPFPRQCLLETKGPLMNTATRTWIGLLVICHVLWSSVYMSYSSALSRTPPALNTWRPVPLQHATYWFHTELVSSTKKSQICNTSQCFEWVRLWIDRSIVLQDIGTEGRG